MTPLAISVADNRIGDILSQLAGHGILLSKRDDLQAYLAEHADLAGLLDSVGRKVRAAFGPTAELSLELYNDPDIDDRYLTLYVRQEPYASDIIDRIEAVCDEFLPQLEAASGFFLVTTDFRRPHAADY